MNIKDREALILKLFSTRKKVECDLRAQLALKNCNTALFNGLIDDYMLLWDEFQELQADIQKRGTKVRKKDSRGQQQIVNNESIDQALKINTQMLRIVSVLGLQPEQSKGGENIDPGEL